MEREVRISVGYEPTRLVGRAVAGALTSQVGQTRWSVRLMGGRPGRRGAGGGSDLLSPVETTRTSTWRLNEWQETSGSSSPLNSIFEIIRLLITS